MIKVAKTGSSSFIHMFPPQAIRISRCTKLENTQQHHTLKTVRKMCRKQRVPVPFTFAFQRNPWDRMISGWLYYNRSLKNKKRHPELDLYTFLDAGMHGRIVKAIFRPVHQYIYDGQHTVDKLLRFENFAEDAKMICEMIGYPGKKILHSNKTQNRLEYQEYYNDKTKDMVARHFARDIKEGGYEF